jgi:hypothetical protein
MIGHTRCVWACENGRAFALSDDRALSMLEEFWISEDVTVLDDVMITTNRIGFVVVGQAFDFASARTARGVVRSCLGG